MVCNQCGAENDPDAVTCVRCEAPQYPSPTEPASIATEVTLRPLVAEPVVTPNDEPLFSFQRPSAAELDRITLAEQRRFYKPALITAALYLALWAPGLVANIRFLQEARETERTIGYMPKGAGCLWSLIIFCVALPALLICMLLALFVAGGS